MNCILAVRLEMKVKFWGRGFAVALVEGLWQVMDKESEGFAYLRQKFSKVSEAKRRKEFLFVHK
jgi:acyl-ACP thioesterase